MNKQYAYFKELPIRTHFVLNGNACIKQSSRTAYIDYAKRWFYFGQNDLCIVGNYSRLDTDYFTQ